MSYIWPEIFTNPALIHTQDPPALCADAIGAWAIVKAGGPIPKTFGDVVMRVGIRLGIKGIADSEAFIQHARSQGWLPDPPIEPIAFWGDEFDMDLLNLLPDLANAPEVQTASAIHLWCYASIAERNGVKVMAHPSTWNGFGVPYFSHPLPPNDNHAMVNVDGTSLVTSEPSVCVSAWTAVRDTWSHNLRLMINWQVWTQPPLYHKVFQPLMHYTRGNYSLPEPKALELKEIARTWALKSCARASRLTTQPANVSVRFPFKHQNYEHQRQCRASRTATVQVPQRSVGAENQRGATHHA